MSINSRQFKFQNVYRFVSLIEECAVQPGSMIEIFWENSNVFQKIGKFSKISVLHEYIFAMICVEERRYFRKNSDIFDDETVKELCNDLDCYAIQYFPFANDNINDSFDEVDLFYAWFVNNEGAFIEYWEKITAEVFHILFSNKNFLFEFNSSVSKYLSDGEVSIPDNLLAKNGKLKRAKYVPIWLKNAIFFRDRGRCVNCNKDLSGLLSTNPAIHYDHIVPLASWGINDPSNIQLLCESCNLKKSASRPDNNYRYEPWWDY